MDIYREIRRLQLDGVTSQRAAAKLLGISRNTVKKYWEGAAVPWDRKTYERNALVVTPEVVLFVKALSARMVMPACLIVTCWSQIKRATTAAMSISRQPYGTA